MRLYLNVTPFGCHMRCLKRLSRMPAKVVIIEDEPDINEAFEYSLSREGYKVWSETDGRRGLDLVRQKSPDLLVLDLMLPSLDGTEICRQIKSDPVLKGTCIIMVTAKTEETDVLVGLGLGADDYVTKPFKTRELLARVHAVLRRGKLREEENTGIIRFDEIVIDTLRHEVTVADIPIQLTATEFRLLRFLAGNPGRVFTRNQLLNHVIVTSWVAENPEIKARIEERIRNVPAANRERAFINAAKSEAMKQAVRPQQGQSVRA